MAKEILPIPVLQPRPSYWQRVWIQLKLFLAIAGFSFVAFMVMGVILTTSPWLLSLQMSAIMSGGILLLGLLVALTNPSMETSEEASYRKRLEFASHYFVNEDQMKADLQELLKTCDELGSDGMKDMKDRDIIQRTIKRAFVN